MKSQEMPRYLLVAHWLLESQKSMSSRVLAEIFGVSHRRMCEDFSSIRLRPDLFEITERKYKCKLGYEYELSVDCINPYRLDGQKYPYAIRTEYPKLSNITWLDLTSRPWHQFLIHEHI